MAEKVVTGRHGDEERAQEPQPQGQNKAPLDYSYGAAAVREEERDLPPRNRGGGDAPTPGSESDGHVSRTSGGVGAPTGDDV